MILDTEREFGNEKKKLVIKPIGILVIEFMLKNFPEICDYEYTKTMEEDLDKIANGENKYYKLCERIDNLIDNTIRDRELDKINKISFKIDDNHTYIIGKNGPVIKYTVGKNTTFKCIKSELVNKIDLEKLENGGYNLNDLIDINAIENINIPRNYLGKYDNKDLYVKNGKYGPYLEWGSNRKSLNNINKAITDITLTDAINIIENKQLSNSNCNNIIREINTNMSIRKGKYGDYIYYKNDSMKRPEFLKIVSFPGDYKKCNIQILKNWIMETYNR